MAGVYELFSRDLTISSIAAETNISLLKVLNINFVESMDIVICLNP